MATIKDIAKLANVSTATVSYVLNESGNISRETREKVQKVIKELNYQPNKIAKSLKMKKTHTIGVIAEDITVFNTPEIINGIYEYAEKCGYSILLTNLRLHKRLGNDFTDPDKCKDIISKVMIDLLSNQVEGIIYIGVHTRDVTGIINIEKPVVYTYCFTNDEGDLSVNYDDEAAAYDATSYLIQSGHKKISIISGRIDSVPSHGRFNGYYKALLEHNLPFQPIYVKTGDWEYESGYRLAVELLALPERPTAILAMNDIMAGGAMDACRESEVLVPGQMSVVGFDNRECSAYYLPKLTTVELPLNQMGRKCMEIIISRLKGEPVAERNVKLLCKIVKRKSVAKQE